MSTATQSLPKIVKFTGMTDAGEYGNATCPHCGAKGRYIYHFTCADDSERGAMAGCLKRFPMHAFAAKHQAILARENEYRAKGWSLPSWDVEILHAIEKFAAGEVTEFAATAIIKRAEIRRRNTLEQKYGRRGRR